MAPVEWHDVQGLVLSGYPALPKSAFVLWRIKTGHLEAARRWLGGIADRITRSADAAEYENQGGNGATPAHHRSVPALKRAVKKKHLANELHAINLALTASGLQALTVDDGAIAKFSVPFREGMAPQGNDGEIARRTFILGDLGENAPHNWFWGAPGGERIDGVLLIYAACERTLDALVKVETDAMSTAFDLVRPTSPQNYPSPALKGKIGADLKEHFGFRDGISQPIIEESRLGQSMTGKERRASVVKTGEIVIGYPNERGSSIDEKLMRNGTYLVMRQLEQDVEAFNKYLTDAAAALGRGSDADACEWVAARLIGRWRNGEPLVPPPADAGQMAPDRNDFLYNYEDPDGLACPIGAHIRRANPRDSLGPDPDTALRLSKMHRIIRRSRLYEMPARVEISHPAANASKVAKAGDQRDVKRGLLFVCLNADIAGQFELIQHNWLNNVHFGGLFDEADAISHCREGDAMTWQSRPLNQRITGMPRFVTVRGGSYFFMPGIAALKALAGSVG